MNNEGDRNNTYRVPRQNAVQPAESVNNTREKNDVTNLNFDYAKQAEIKLDKINRRLTEVTKNFEDILDKELVETFSMTEESARNIKGFKEKLRYLIYNGMSLNTPMWAPKEEKILSEAQKFVTIIKELQADSDKIIQDQNTIRDRNQEVLKDLHEELIQKKERADALEIENAQLLQTIPDIEDSELYKRVQAAKAEITEKSERIDALYEEIGRKEEENLKSKNEIKRIKELRQKENCDIRDLNEQIRKLTTKLNKAKPEDKEEIEKEIAEKEADRRKKEANLLVYNSDIGVEEDKIRTNENSIRKLNNTIDKTQIAIKEYENKTYLPLFNELTEERKNDTAEVKKYKRNLKEIEKIREYENNLNYIKNKERIEDAEIKCEENRENLKNNFSAKNLKAATSTRADANGSNATQQQATQTGAAAPTNSGGNANVSVAGGSLVPAGNDKKLSDKEYANNFYNNVVNGNLSPRDLKLKLSGYEFARFVNACQYLTPKQRKKLLPIIKERRIRLDGEGKLLLVKDDGTPELDEDGNPMVDTNGNPLKVTTDVAFQRIFGDSEIYSLVYDDNDKPKRLSELSEDQIRKLSMVAEEFNKKAVKYSKRERDFIESKFFDVIANTAVFDLYESTSTFGGRFKNWLSNARNDQKVQVIKELRGTACQYHKEKADGFPTARARENKFYEKSGLQEILQNHLVKSNIDSPGKNVESIENDQGYFGKEIDNSRER